MSRHETRSDSLRSTLALLACLLLLLSGVAQQRAFAAKLGNPASHVGLCLSAPETAPGLPTGNVLHDCFECCLGTQPTLPALLPAPGIVIFWQAQQPVASVLILPARAVAAWPPSRGPPEQA